MKNPFKQENTSFRGITPITPYQKACQEWDLRIGSSRIQARNWRLAAIFSLIITIMLAIILTIVLVTKKDHLYIAEVTKEGRIINVAPLIIKYQPTEAQKNFFITHFIELIRTIPLDPVLAKKNWISAYSFLNSHSAEKLNTYFKQNNPVALLGKSTVSVQIVDINPISPTTTHVDWIETTVTSNGKQSNKDFNGVFTINVKQPTKQKEILGNPLGLYIIEFNISPKEFLGGK